MRTLAFLILFACSCVVAPTESEATAQYVAGSHRELEPPVLAVHHGRGGTLTRHLDQFGPS